MAGWRRAVLHGGGVARVGNLPALLSELSLVPRAQAEASSVDGVLAWGRKPSAIRAEAWARARGLPLVRLEDGFLRSIGLGPEEAPLSIVVDDLGIYYDAGGPSRLEQMIAAPIEAPAQARGAGGVGAQVDGEAVVPRIVMRTPSGGLSG